ncbi:Transmembrane protein [Pseudolycoriella hygida]|uniref:Transmembrane protein n=1 Tax=Pseudolycoriella hygida TaxID=35572 RepID=A0A9Q0RZP1_9DIPT|nr:Transmembrane protein [Pseudolycoriella hygida]
MDGRHENGETYKAGLTTEQALKILHEDIENVVLREELKFSNESFLNKAKCSFAKPYDSPMGWFPMLITLLSVFCLYATYYYLSATILLLILVATTILVIRENILRRTEIHRKTQTILEEIALAKILCKNWTEVNYPNLCCPLSPCVTLQWTYRDGIIVNLPWALLVQGDHIIIRPGQVAPGQCTEINNRHTFQSGETYGVFQPSDPPLKPTARAPLPDLVCIMQVTPYLETLKTSFKSFLKRPATIYNQQRCLLVTKYIQTWGCLLALALTIGFGVLKYFSIIFSGKMEKNYLFKDMLENFVIFVECDKSQWKELFLELPVCAVLPILPLVFPLLWNSVNLWGIARLETLLALPQTALQSDEEKTFQADLDTPTFECEATILPSKEVFINWLGLWQGNSYLLGRSANVVQVLGSITALCCVDKKGILSWPNPTAEKVFFLRDSSDKLSKKSESSLESELSKEEKGGTVSEVLDLTHDQHSAFKLEFDDHEWKNHINSLKPLGLAILVNTCCPLTQEHYAKFCGHVTAVAMLDKDLVPVTNRYAIVESRMNSFMHGRCLCELAKQIGFTPSAREIFNLEGQIASYMHLQPEVVKRDIRFARQLQIASKVKVPFPHCLSVVMRESHSQSLQLMTQGTADIVLDCCDDFWDGSDLRPLTAQERKRAQDFYQRSALTAYCTAFSYRPLRHGIRGALGGGNSGVAYLELPPESKYHMSHEEHPHFKFDCHNTLQHSISTDSLLFSDNKEEDANDVAGCFEMQCHQVFIGMVTMQYQAQTDVVQLIERLDRACVRFVHFSKENELRSRVFSEKMGLESGWNCHISLLSESTSSLPSPKSSRNFGNNIQSNVALNMENEINAESELNRLLPPSGLESTKNLSSSAPGAISNQDQDCSLAPSNPITDSIESLRYHVNHHRHSKDSAMGEENCRSLSVLTDSTEQSAPVNFDMSNRAKLPRGIENIQPHIENVDNVPLLVSLFTDCSAEATREMLGIMQSYGEIVVCLGSSASNANAEIFLQADCSIGIEPLYPQVCQDIPAFTESNILNNKLSLTKEQNDRKWYQAPKEHLKNTTLSPIYLSRMLNTISCSISVRREDPLSIVSLIELSRRFSNGLWNCIQFWACCGSSLAIMNTLCACISLPPLLTPFSLIYLMTVAIPLLSVTLVRISPDHQIMNRATGKKQTKFDSKVFLYVLCCYGCKFLPTIIIMMLSYCTFMAHPVILIDLKENDFKENLDGARTYLLFAIVVHFVIISIGFVHRDDSIWKKNPFSNIQWVAACSCIILIQLFTFFFNILFDDVIFDNFYKVWPIVLFVFASGVVVFAVTEICKWEELKVNLRYQRRARLDFGTKLGMNSPF